MKTKLHDRRHFLTQAAGVAMAAGYLGFTAASPTRAAQTASKEHPIRLGAPVFQAPEDPEGLARFHKEQGYRAAYCPQVELDDTDRICDYRKAFEKHNVVVAEMGRWVNLMEADSGKRAENLKVVTDGLALAEEIGARCCVDIAGSFSEEAWFGPHPKNISEEFFDASVENARKIIDAVRPRRAKFCFEMMGWALPDSADSYARLMKAVDRDAFGVHLDPANLINSPERFYRNTDLVNECFDKLGPWIVSCHAKDVAWDVAMQIQFREVTLGAGKLDYSTYLKRLAALPNDVPLMIEHMKGPKEYAQSRDHLFRLGAKIGVSFG